MLLDLATIFYHFYQAKRLEASFKNRAELEYWQQSQIARMIKFNLHRSAYYKPYCKRQLSDFPIVNKEIMLQSFDQINTAGISLDEALYVTKKAEDSRDFTPQVNDITVGLSSGTSGKQSIFLASKAERLKWAGIMLAKALPGKISEQHKVAFFLRANSNLYTTLATGKRIKFHFFDLTRDFYENIQKLNCLKPTILTAPASVLKKIAQLQECNELNIHPKKIISVAEVLYADDQLYIEKIYNQTVQQIYQCTEGFLGITKPNGKLYLNEEFVHIEKEWIDKATGRFVPIITDFTRQTQPIIRYRLDDVLIEDFSDPTPFTCLQAIDGRCDDVFYLKSHKGEMRPIFADTLRQAIAVTDVVIDEYRIVQKSPTSIEVQTHPLTSKVANDIISDRIFKLCHQQNCKLPAIDFCAYANQPIYNKHKRVERICSIPKVEANL